MRLATWNVNSLGARLPLVLEWMEANGPDVLCLQETKLADDAFPTAAFADLGYQSAHYGDGRWNGVAIVSRVGLDDPVNGFHSDEDAQGTRIVAATCEGVRVHSVYVPNGRSLDSEHFGFKLAWLARLRAYLAETDRPDGAVAVCGDFNVAPRDTDVWDPAQFVGATHVSEPERAALGDVLDWGLVDVFPASTPTAGSSAGGTTGPGTSTRATACGSTWSFSPDSLADRCTSVEIDREARKKSPAGNKPSDHTVVVAEIDLGAGPPPEGPQSAGSTTSTSDGPGSASDRSSWVTSSSAVVARAAGTPRPVARATKSRSGRERSSRRPASGPTAPAPTRESSRFKMAYERLARTTVVTFSPSRACVQSAWTVYMALPSASRQRTGRSAAATAAPVATGRPWPMAPPVSVNQSCRGHPTVAPG